MIRAVVFSKDRPMQLDALLRSIDLYAPRLYDEVIVIWKASSPAMRDGYDFCRIDHIQIDFWEQEPLFSRDVAEACDWDGLLVFHCDDDLFFRPAPEPLVKRPVFAFSFRLGVNTVHCHPLNEDQAVPLPNLSVDEKRLAWYWAEQPERSDFSYPFSLDGHVISATAVREILSAIEPPENPNQLEARGVSLVRADPAKYGELMFSPAHSCLVSVPANRVQDEFPNPCSTNPEWQPEALLERYLAGERILLERMDFTVVRGAHQEVPLVIGKPSSSA